MSRKVKELEMRCDDLETRVDRLLCQTESLYSTMLSKDQARKRDYIVRTNYIGKITDHALLSDFKKEIEQQLKDNFESCCSNILNFQLIDLYKFREILNLYEMKQIILDTYKPKKSKAE